MVENVLGNQWGSYCKRLQLAIMVLIPAVIFLTYFGLSFSPTDDNIAKPLRKLSCNDTGLCDKQRMNSTDNDTLNITVMSNP